MAAAPRVARTARSLPSAAGGRSAAAARIIAAVNDVAVAADEDLNEDGGRRDDPHADGGDGCDAPRHNLVTPSPPFSGVQ